VLNDTKPGFVQGSQTVSVKDVEELLRWLTWPNSLRDDLQHNEWPLWIQRAFRALHSLLERHSLLVIDDEPARIVSLGPSFVEVQDKIASYDALGIVLRPVGKGAYPPFPGILYKDAVRKIIGPCFMLASSKLT